MFDLETRNEIAKLERELKARSGERRREQLMALRGPAAASVRPATQTTPLRRRIPLLRRRPAS